MKLNRELYLNAFEQYRRWNELKTAERKREAASRTPAQAFRQYVELYEFCRNHGREPGERQRAQKLAALDEYYQQIITFEARRRANEKQS